jgi:hypothetical protein
MELFMCPKNPWKTRLTKNTCAALWKRMQRVEWESNPNWRCRTCEVGQANAGVTVVAHHPVRSKTCFRCGRHIGFGRKTYNSICISCFNRMTEVFRGKNSKGNPPVKCKLFVFRLIVDGKEVKLLCGANMVEFLERMAGHNIEWPDLDKPASKHIPNGYDTRSPLIEIIQRLENGEFKLDARNL